MGTSDHLCRVYESIKILLVPGRTANAAAKEPIKVLINM
jgi:hypothetical protein